MEINLENYIQSELDELIKRNQDNEDFKKVVKLYELKLQEMKKLNQQNITNEIPKKIPKVKDKTAFDLKIEADFITFINTYCDVGQSGSIKAKDFMEKYNKINNTELSSIRVGKVMNQIINDLQIKKVIKSDGTHYFNIIFKENI